MAGVMRLTWRRTTVTSPVARSGAGLWWTPQTSTERSTPGSLPPRRAQQEGPCACCGQRCSVLRKVSPRDPHGVCTRKTFVFLYALRLRTSIYSVVHGLQSVAILPQSLLLSPALGPSHSSPGICSHFSATFQPVLSPGGFSSLFCLKHVPEAHQLIICCFSLASARLLRSLPSPGPSTLGEKKRKPGHINIY